MAEKIEFDLSVKGGENGNDLTKSIEFAIKKAFSLEDALSTAVGVFSGNVFTKALSSISNQLSKAVDESIAFKKAQLEIETILPKNEKLTANLVKQLENLSSQYGTTSTAQAKAYYEIISAGVQSAADGTKLLAKANELATGGVTDAAKTIDLLTTIYNVYGKEVATSAEASDSLFKTVQLGKTTISELAADLGQALPIAKSFGIGLDEVGSILAQLTNAGITTSESVTLLNAVLAAIAKNGDKLGPGLNSLAVETDGLGKVLERLKEKTNGSNDALFELLGRQEAVRAVQALTSKGLENYNKTLDEYKNKSGVAADASKKIIDNDIGKQFEILGSNILNVSRNFIDTFNPAVLEATKILNGLFSSDNQRDTQATRDLISEVTLAYKNQTISAEQYRLQIEKLNNDLSVLTSQSREAIEPTIGLGRALEAQAEGIKNSISEIQNGISGLSLGPIEQQIQVGVLNKKLDETLSKINEIKATTASGKTVVDSVPATDAEKKLQAELSTIREQAAANQLSFEDQLALALDEKRNSIAENQTNIAFEKSLRDAEVAYNGEIAKNDAILKGQELKLQNDIAFAKKEELQKKAARDKEVADIKSAQSARLALEQSFQNARNGVVVQGFGLAAALAKDGSKTQFAIQKAAAIAEIAIADGKARALIPAQVAAIPFPASIAAAAGLNAYVTAQTALGTATVLASAIKGFAGGGIVGASMGGDNRLATVRDGEMVLNAGQQKQLFDAINSGGVGGSAPIVIQIDGREVFRAVRDQLNNGMRFA